MNKHSVPAFIESTSQVLVPCLPLLKEAEEGEVGTVLLPEEVSLLLEEEKSGLRMVKGKLEKAIPTASLGVVSSLEVYITCLMKHLEAVANAYIHGADYIEQLMREQLVSAIGKVLSPADFSAYMKHHQRQIYAEEYLPSPFCHAVRRSSQHGPEGFLSIENEVTGGIKEPVETLNRELQGQEMEFPLTAATKIKFGGTRRLHALLRHDFAGSGPSRMTLHAQARQFSSYIVMVGRITGAKQFEPTYGTIVKNKDDLEIPLDLEMIPTPQAFKAAISSLSPQQQDFAKAFRGLQLESTLFGVLVIQIKPLLERVLNLPSDSLTKEIKLSQDLMDLFVKYQIPSDLLAYDTTRDQDQDQDQDPSEKIQAVKGHVKVLHSI